jgi:hypothetical protein
MTRLRRINPCRSCVLIDADKNNATCLNCRRRVAYVDGLQSDLSFCAGRSAEAPPLAGWGGISRRAGCAACPPDGPFD